MLIFIQFPITDLRQFVDFDSGKLSRPVWPIPTPYSEFIRNCGSVVSQPLGNRPGWMGLNTYCRAKNLIKLLDLTSGLLNDGTVVHFKCLSRELYFDGLALARFLCVFEVRTKPQTNNLESVLKICRILLNKKVRIAYSPKTIPLRASGRAISEMFTIATTANSHKHIIPEALNWVNHGRPLIFVEQSGDENYFGNDDSNQKYDLNPKISAYHNYLNCDSSMMPYWCLTSKSSTGIRQFRVNIMRLDAENNGIRELIKAIDSDSIIPIRESVQSEKLQEYINISISEIDKRKKRLEKFEIPDSVKKTFYAYYDQAQCDALKNKLISLRPQIARKMESVLTDTPPDIKYADLAILIEELVKLRQEIQSTRPEKFGTLDAIGQAEIAAKNRNRDAIVKALSKAGKWTLDIAQDVGVSVLSTVLRQSLGLT